MKKYILKYPLTYIFYFSFSFALGTGLSFLFKNTNAVFILLSHAFLFIFLSLIFFKIIILRIVFLSLAFVIAGYSYSALRYYGMFNYPLTEHEENIKVFTARVVSYNGVNKNRHVYFADVDFVHNGKEFVKRSGRIRLYNYTDKKILVGDKIAVRSKLSLYKNIFTNNTETDNIVMSMLEKKILVGVSGIYRYENVTVNERSFHLMNVMNSYASVIRKHVKKYLSIMPPINYSVAQCLLIGDRNILPNETQNIFRKAAMAHLTAVSGLHLGIIYFIFFMIISFFPIGIYKKIIISTLLSVLIYIPLTLFSVSVMRASFMLLILMISILFDRNRNAINALMITAFVILLIEPNAIREISFQFSFLATFAILIFMPIVYRRIKNMSDIPRVILSFLSINIIATSITIPLASNYFSALNMNAFLTNIIAIPLAFLIILCDILIVFLTPLFPALAVFPANTNIFMTNMFLKLAEYFSSNSVLYFEINISFPLALILTFLICILGVILRVSEKNKKERI